jgi:catechol-2,3-dioxygenase
MPTNQVEQPWAIRSTLVAVTDLDRSVDFYQKLGPFDELIRENGVAVLGGKTTESVVLILRETQGMQSTRHGQQSLGLRSITFKVGSLSELDRIESVLRDQGHFTTRRNIADGSSELLLGRDPDNLPLAFVCYAENEQIGHDYYHAVANLVWSLDT